MKKGLCLFCCAALLLVALALPGALRRLPWEGHSPAQSAYAGVIRLWVYEDLRFLAPWLSRCCDRFERAHSGVYVQTQWVSEAEMRLSATGEITVPDAVIFPSGMLPTSEGLSSLSSVLPYSALPRSDHALPVAMNGYLWCEAVSPHASETDAPTSLVCPEDGPHTSYSAALIAASARYAQSDSKPQPIGEGMELGLPTPQPTRPVSFAQPVTRLPAALARNDAACSLLARGETPAILVSRRAYATLSSLSLAGRSVEYTLFAPGAPFTDLVYWFSVPAGENPDREEAAKALGYFLLEEDCQSQLSLAGAFRTVPGTPLYDAASGMVPLESALSSSKLLAAPPFGDDWREITVSLWNRCFSGELDAWTALAQLKSVMESKIANQH